MPAKDFEIKKLFTLIAFQHALNQLHKLQSKYQSFIDNLTSGEKILKEQLEADLLPYLDSLEKREKLAEIMRDIIFVAILDEKFFNYLFILKQEEISEYLKLQEKVSNEFYDNKKQMMMEGDYNKKTMEQKLIDLLEKAEKIIKKLQEEIALLKIEISKLQIEKIQLMESIKIDKEKVDLLMKNLLDDLANSDKSTEVDVNGCKIVISDKDIVGVVLGIHDKYERELAITKYIASLIPKEKMNSQLETKIVEVAKAENVRLENSMQNNSEYIEYLDTLARLRKNEKRVEVINIEIDIKQKQIEIKEEAVSFLREEINLYKNNINERKEIINESILKLEKVIDSTVSVTLLKKIEIEDEYAISLEEDEPRQVIDVTERFLNSAVDSPVIVPQRENLSRPNSLEPEEKVGLRENSPKPSEEGVEEQRVFRSR